MRRLDKESTTGTSAKDILLVLLGTSQSSWPRGLRFAQSFTGIGMTEDKKLAGFLFSKAKPEEKRTSLDAAWVHVSHSMSPDLVIFFQSEGDHPAPYIQSDRFLLLTTAAKSRQAETVKLLLEAGADPRQAASLAHGTVLSGSKVRPEIQGLLTRYLNGRNPNVVFRPSYGGDWQESHCPNHKWKECNT